MYHVRVPALTPARLSFIDESAVIDTGLGSFAIRLSSPSFTLHSAGRLIKKSALAILKLILTVSVPSRCPVPVDVTDTVAVPALTLFEYDTV